MSLRLFLLRRGIELLPAFVRQNVHPLIAAKFGDRLSPRARAHYHKSQINTVRSTDNNFLIRLWWNLVTELIHRLNSRKAPGYDQISNKAIKELSIKGIALISSIFNAILRLEYYPKTWETSLITLISKLGKPIHETSSYRPISLLSSLSKLFEKLLTNRLVPLLEDLKTQPDHQFGFRK